MLNLTLNTRGDRDIVKRLYTHPGLFYVTSPTQLLDFTTLVNGNPPYSPTNRQENEL